MPGTIPGRTAMPHRRALLAAPLLGLAARLGAAQQQAQAPWPSRPLRMVIPWPPGHSTDVQGRLVAQWLSDRPGQAVVPENRPGAGGHIGTPLIMADPPLWLGLAPPPAGPGSS